MDNKKIEVLNKNRLVGLDISRALAVFGMILINFKVVMWDWTSGPEWLKSVVSFFEGKAAATFVILAGIGISLLTKKARETNDLIVLKEKRNLLLKRALFLFVFGLLYTPLWPADILHFYGIYIAAAAFLLKTTSRRLLFYAYASIPVFFCILLVIPYETGWNFGDMTYLDLWTFSGMFRHLFFNGFHPVFPWLFFLFFGMWLGRKNLSSLPVVKKFFIRALSVLITVELFSKTLTLWFPLKSLNISAETAGLITSTSPMPPLPFYLVSGTAFAITLICFCIIISTKNPSSGLIRPFIHTGQMALTLYFCHVIIGMGLPEELGMLQNNSLETVLLYALVFSILSLFSAHFYKKKFKRGPVEMLIRKIT